MNGSPPIHHSAGIFLFIEISFYCLSEILIDISEEMSAVLSKSDLLSTENYRKRDDTCDTAGISSSL